MAVPFETCARSFTAASLKNNAPTSAGVYGLSDARSWLFLAETGNIQAALELHLRTENKGWGSRKPLGFSFETCTGVERTRRLKELVRECCPIFQN